MALIVLLLVKFHSDSLKTSFEATIAAIVWNRSTLLAKITRNHRRSRGPILMDRNSCIESHSS
jgi:hypothetical protein